MSNFLTIAIPSYRQPVELSRALHALTLQTFKDFRIVIIDDNSGIDIVSIVHTYTKILDITIIKNQKNLGAMKNMLKSILLECETKYIFSHHEDDYIKSNYLEIAITALEKNADISYILTSPVWIKKDDIYTQSKINSLTIEKIDSHNFMVRSLDREPFIFGSVIYRREDITTTLKLEKYFTLCDKIFLTEILLNNGKKAGYVSEPGIYVHDHSLDQNDTRSTGVTLAHMINFFIFYQKHLTKKTIKIKRLITNNFLLGCTHLPGKVSLNTIYAEQKMHTIISFAHLNSIGVYSIIRLILKNTSYF